MTKDFTIDFVNQFFLKNIPVQNKDYQYSIIIIICLSHLCSILKDNTKALELLNDFLQFIDQKETLSQRLIFYFNNKFDLNDLSKFFGNKNNIYLEKISFISILMLGISTDDEKDALNFIEELVQYIKLDKEIISIQDYFNDNLKKEIINKTKLDNKIYNHISNYIDYRNKFKNTINLDKWNVIKLIFFEDLKKLSTKLHNYNYNILTFYNYKKLESYLQTDLNKDDYSSEFVISNNHLEKLFDSINNFFEINKKEFEHQLKYIKKLENQKNDISEKIFKFKCKIKDESNNIKNYSEICINKIIVNFNIDISKKFIPELSHQISKFDKKIDKDLVGFTKIKLNTILLNWIEKVPLEIVLKEKEDSIKKAFNNVKESYPNIKENYNKREESINKLNESIFNFESIDSKNLYDFEVLKKSIKSSLTSSIPGIAILILSFLFPYLRILSIIFTFTGGYLGFSTSKKNYIQKKLLKEIEQKFKENKIDEKIRLAIKNEIEKIFDSLAKDFENSFSHILKEMEYQLDIVTKDYNNYLESIDDSEKSIKTKILNLEIDIAKIQFLKENITTKLSKIYINSIK